MKITVTQLNNYISGLVSCDSVLTNIAVSGETLNVKVSRDYVYFTLKDEQSQVECFSYAHLVKNIQSGQNVTAFGKINYLTKFGRLSFFVNSLQIDDKEGLEKLKMLQLKERLANLGCFDPANKVPVPDNAQNIGVVTSASGAVIHDICQVVARRNPSVNIVLYSVKVQGVGADLEIAQGISYFSNEQKVDCVIVARGGGSDSDLAPFNSEAVAMAVYNSKIPVVSAVGHGINTTFCDYSADLACATPSEAAERITKDRESAKRQLFDKLHLIKTIIQNKIDSINNSVGYTLRVLDAYNPTNVLKKGYAILNVSGRQVKSIDDLSVGDKVEIVNFDGKVLATIDEILEKTDDVR